MVAAITPKNCLVRGCGFLIIWCTLNLVVWQWGEYLARSFLPLYKMSFSEFSNHYELLSMRLVNQLEPTFNIQVITTGQRELGELAVPNGIVIDAQTLQGHAFQSVIIMLSMLFIWPLQRAWHRGVLLIVALPIMVVILMLDVPLVLLGSLEDLVLANFYPEILTHSVSIMAMNSLNGGGRLLLGVLGAGISTLITLLLLQMGKSFQKH